MEKVRSFNTLYGELIDRLVIEYPAIGKLQEWGGLFQLMKKANVRGPLEHFMKNVSPYTEKILNEDIEFFRNSGSLRSHASSIVTDSGLDDLWDDLDADSQANIWKYLQGLIKLGYSSYGIRGTKSIMLHFRRLVDSDMGALNYLNSI